MSKRIKSTAELAQLDFSKTSDEEVEKAIGPNKFKKLITYFNKADKFIESAQSKREKRRQKNLELKSRMS